MFDMIDSTPIPAICGPANSARASHTLPDWLALHDLSAEDCRDVLARARKMSRAPAPTCILPVSQGSDAWALAATALARLFPRAEAAIHDTERRTQLEFVTGPVQPATLPGHDGRPAMVRLPWRRRASDLLIVAHEFGHALQAHLTPHDFIPPASREIAAFVAEHALLDMLRRHMPGLFAQVNPAWSAGNRVYLARGGDSLRAALVRPQSPYHYSWNYPIARPLASELFDAPARGRLYALFTHPTTPGRLLRYLRCPARNRPSCDAACLALGLPARTGAAGPPP